MLTKEERLKFKDKMVKAPLKFVGKSKSNEFWCPGIVTQCFDYFALVQFKNMRSCYPYSEIVEIDENEYKKLIKNECAKKALISES